jgi:membrane protein DedA with SNARE-associated domain
MTATLMFHAGELRRLIDDYGYAIVFTLVGAESVGLPLPGETTLVVASISAGATGRLNIAGVIAAAAAGAFIGDNVGYGIGRVGGYRLIRRYGRYLHVDDHRLKIARYLFDRYGPVIVFIGRFVSILRTYAAFLAGTTRMRWQRFVFFNAAGGITWSVTYGVLAFYFGAAITRLGPLLNVALAAAAIAAAAAGFLVVRRKEIGFGEAAERAFSS